MIWGGLTALYTDVPIHRNVHYVPAARLDAFFDGWGEYAELRRGRQHAA